MERSSDPNDQASDLSDEYLKEALENKREEGPPPIGRCYNCDSPISPRMRWCDEDCRCDWEFRISRKG